GPYGHARGFDGRAKPVGALDPDFRQPDRERPRLHLDLVARVQTELPLEHRSRLARRPRLDDGGPHEEPDAERYCPDEAENEAPETCKQPPPVAPGLARIAARHARHDRPRWIVALIGAKCPFSRPFPPGRAPPPGLAYSGVSGYLS